MSSFKKVKYFPVFLPFPSLYYDNVEKILIQSRQEFLRNLFRIQSISRERELYCSHLQKTFYAKN